MNDATKEFVFNVRFPRTWTLDRRYRVYCHEGELFLIRVGGQNMDMVTMQFGLLGVLLAAWLRPGDKSAEEISRQDKSHPRELLSNHKHNFSIQLSDVVDSALVQAPLLPQHGPCAGRWTLALRDGKQLNFDFEDLEQMHCAMQHLPALLSGTIRVEVQWDDQKQKYRKA